MSYKNINLEYFYDVLYSDKKINLDANDLSTIETSFNFATEFAR